MCGPSTFDRAMCKPVNSVVEREPELVSAEAPLKTLDGGARVRLIPSGLRQREKRHGCHRVLMNGVDLVWLDNHTAVGPKQPWPAAVWQPEFDQLLGESAGEWPCLRRQRVPRGLRKG